MVDREGGDWMADPREILVRPAVETDAPRLQRYVAELFSERLPVLFIRDGAPSIEQERGFIRQMSESPRSVLLVAEVAGEIVGMADFHGHPEPQRAHSGEFGMSTAQQWRGRGVGTRLLERLLEWAREQHMERVELRVFSNNTGAIRLYERFGFVTEGRQVNAVRLADGYVDIIFMAKLL